MSCSFTIKKRGEGREVEGSGPEDGMCQVRSPGSLTSFPLPGLSLE